MAEQKGERGLIVRALGGFYYVELEEETLECRARGLFRKEEISPVVGDWVTVERTEAGKGFVVEIEPRKNVLIRPPVANLDRLVLVVSTVSPAPNLMILDQLTAIAERRHIPVVLVFTKIDLSAPDSCAAIYRQAGYPVYEVNSLTGEGVPAVQEELKTGISAFCGNSGAGKSSLLNALFPGLSVATGDISKKLGRGRHTTRHVELFPTGSGGYIADTPGFSAIEFLQFEKMAAGELESCFPEFEPFLGKCRFTGCSHTAEKGCAVLEAVQAGTIPRSRHESYKAIYQELKQIKPWELK